MKQLTINPKEKGTTIKFGKLPIFTRSLTHWADMDNVVQLKVEGRHYAIELRPSPLEEALEKMKAEGVYLYSATTAEALQDDEVAEESKADVKEANAPAPEFTEYKTTRKKAKKPTNELESLGFTSLQASPDKEKPLKPFTRGNLELSQWLKPQDYLIYRLFVYGNGQVSAGKAVTFDDVRDIFLELPDVEAKKKRGASGKTAGRIANVAITQLIKKGVLAKEQPEVVNKKNIFSLTLLKGGQYARKVYYTVSKGTYREGKGRTRELCDQSD